MQIIRGTYNLKPKHQNCVVTIGNFDGVHLGHQALLKKLVNKARELHLPAVVITFEPQPNEYFKQDKIPPRLMRLREKIMALESCGVDRVLVLRFNQAMANVTAEQFIEKILVAGLRIQYLIIGDDFRFGYKRQGDFDMLQQSGKKFNFSVEKMDAFKYGNDRVSSSGVRKALEGGDLQLAQRLLSRPFALSGHIAHGDKRGRIIGFPTANIYLHRKAVPIMGVYVVRVYGLTSEPIHSVANVGNRPTVGGTRSLLEVHMFDFNQEVYGKHVSVEFIHKLRDEKRYDSFELLKQQIFRDAEQAREFFKK
jgi:riboflavin kinase / FMN adenylyltransferase